jgi:hypothetical protein
MKVPSFYNATFSVSLTVETIPAGSYNVFYIVRSWHITHS